MRETRFNCNFQLYQIVGIISSDGIFGYKYIYIEYAVKYNILMISSLVLSTQKSSEDTTLFLFARGTDGIEVISVTRPAASRESAASVAVSAVRVIQLSNVGVHRPSSVWKYQINK